METVYTHAYESALEEAIGFLQRPSGGGKAEDLSARVASPYPVSPHSRRSRSASTSAPPSPFDTSTGTAADATIMDNVMERARDLFSCVPQSTGLGGGPSSPTPRSPTPRSPSVHTHKGPDDDVASLLGRTTKLQMLAKQARPRRFLVCFFVFICAADLFAIL